MKRTKQFHGVNLGNWLVLEKWMSPEMFDGTDAEDETWLNREASWGMIPDDSFFANLSGEYEKYRQTGRMTREILNLRMEYHRETYVTLDDFRFLAKLGITHVRIPVPYFIFGNRPPYIGCVKYLDRAFEWAEETGIKILIDLHTTPGGQNGYDNGGITGVCKWSRNPHEVRFILSVLKRLAERYGSKKALFGIEVLNEPISLPVYLTAPSTGKAKDPEEVFGSGPVSMVFLKSFYVKAYNVLRKYLPDCKAVVFHDGFRLNAWGAFFRRNHMKNVYLDAHIYLFAMENIVRIHSPLLYKFYLGIDKIRIALAKPGIPVIVGEYCLCNEYSFGIRKNFASPAMDGYGVSPSAVKYETDKPISEKEKASRFRLIDSLEKKAFASCAGLFYWNYELERDINAPLDNYYKEAWDLRRCIKHKWISV